MENTTRTINKHIFTWLGGVLFGALGLDRFMRGQILGGVLKLITCGGFGIWWIVDMCIATYKAYGIEGNLITFDEKGKWL